MDTVTVDVFFRDRGYGFGSHVDKDGVRTNVFIHIKDVVQGYPIAPGTTVQCDLVRNNLGFVAKNVRVVPAQAGGADALQGLPEVRS